MTPLVFAICDTIGFQVTTASCEVSLMNAVAISESEVFTSFTFLIWLSRPFSVMARSNRYSRNGLLHQQKFLAGKMLQRRDRGAPAARRCHWNNRR